MAYGNNTYKGWFRPQNPQKYNGNPENIIYRSSWELRCMKYFDDHPDIIWWSSEEIIVPYRSPVDGKVHRYYPDFIIKVRQKDGGTKTIMIEIKPKSQTKPPDVRKKNATPSGRISRRYINEVKTYGINEAKWIAARKFCAEKGWQFQIITEDHLGIK